MRCYSKGSISPKAKFEIPPTVRLFENTTLNPNLFRVTTVVSGIQLCLWCYLSYFALVELNPEQGLQQTKPEDVAREEAEEKKPQEKSEEDEAPALFVESNTHTDRDDKDSNFLESGGTARDDEGSNSLNGGSTAGYGEDSEPAKSVSTGKDSASEEKPEAKETPSKMYKWFMSSKWRLSLSILSLGAGAVFAMVAYIYPQRMVRTMTYFRPTQLLEVQTYSPWGSVKTLEVPLNDVLCNTSPEQVASGQNIALKFKDYSLYFMLNTRNTTSHPLLSSLVLRRRKI